MDSPPASPADCPGTPIDFTCAGEMNSPLRQGFRLWRKRLYAGLPARTLTKHFSLQEAGRRSIVDHQTVDQKKNEIQWQRSFLIDKNRLGKKYGDRGVPGAFLVTFRRRKSHSPRRAKLPLPRGVGRAAPKIPSPRGTKLPCIGRTRWPRIT